MATQAERDLMQLREMAEKLSGVRGDANKSQSAVRRSELYPLASLTMKSGQITASPTQAQYNALQTDVANIFKALQRISNILGNGSPPEG